MAVHNITVDCTDPYDPAALVAGPERAPGLLFLQVPEDKTVKNRVHVDLQPRGRTRDQEVAPAVELGAKVYADHRRPDGTGFVVLTDPEGNEFCIVRSAAERGSG